MSFKKVIVKVVLYIKSTLYAISAIVLLISLISLLILVLTIIVLSYYYSYKGLVFFMYYTFILYKTNKRT
jgi:uncharacterized membrane protein